MKLVKTNDPDFCKDEVNGGVINTNVSAYKAYKMQRNSEKYVSNLNNQVTTLQNEVKDLKNLIKEFLRDRDGNSNS